MIRHSDSLVVLFTLMGCTEKADTSGSDSGQALDSGIERDPVPPHGNLLIEEVYYSGAVPVEGIDRYYSDQFIELINTADAPVMLGGLMIGDAPGTSGPFGPGDTPAQRWIGDPERVYLSSVWQIPGAPEDVLLPPGASIVIAQDAQNHQPFSPLDLSGAAIVNV